MSGTLILRSPDDDIHVGAVSPYALRYTVTSADSAFDLLTVTAARFEVLRPDGSEDTWSGLLLQNPLATSLDLVRVFTVTDLPIPGLYVIEPFMTVPGGEFKAACRVLKVRANFECEAA